MRKYFFWGFLLLLIGTLWLLKLTSIIDFSVLDFLYLWPLILVWIGIGFLPIHDGFKILLDIASMTIGVVIIVSPVNFNNYSCFNNREIKIIETVTWSSDHSKLAKLTFNAGATEVTFSPGNENLIDILGDKSENVDISIKENNYTREVDVSLDILPFHNNVIKGPFTIVLNQQPIWEMDINLGASSNHIDLSPFNVKELDISSGASEIFLKVGDLYPNINIDLSIGASSITVEIPNSMNCTIENSSALSSNHFSGFTQTDRGVYHSFSSDSISKGNIQINITSGVSDITVVKY